MKKDISLMIDDVKLNIRTSALFVCGNKVLLHKPPNEDFWNIPGGRVKIGEDSFSAIKREMKEELDFDIKKEEMIVYLENFFNYNNSRYHELLTVYKIEINENQELAKKQDFENLDGDGFVFHWFDKSEIKNLKCLPEIIYEIVEKNNKDIIHKIIKK